MTVEDATTLHKRLVKEFVGKPMSSSGPSVAPDPVNIPMIRHWVDAMDDRNPLYLDDPSGAVAPPAMLQTWTMGRPTIQGLAERGGAPSTLGHSVIGALDEAGYKGTRATNSELEFVRYLQPGDEVHSTTLLESISDEKTTALGIGFFVTWVTTYRDQTDEVIGRQSFRVLKFKPMVGEQS